MLQEGPSSYDNHENYDIYENCEIHDNSLANLPNRRNLFKGLQGKPNERYENYEFYKNCGIRDNLQDN